MSLLPGANRTQPILVASICAGVIGYTLSRALKIDILLAYAVTVVVVFAVTIALFAYRDR